MVLDYQQLLVILLAIIMIEETLLILIHLKLLRLLKDLVLPFLEVMRYAARSRAAAR